MLILYADILFAINFSMDFLTLFLCKIILHRKLYKGRIIVASLLGALFAVVEVVYIANGWISIALSIIVSTTMCVICYKEATPKRALVNVLMYLN